VGSAGAVGTVGSGRSFARSIVVAGTLAIAVSCGGTLVKWPAGPGTPASEGAAAWAEAIEPCRGVGTYLADLSVSGRVGSTRVPRIVIGTQLTRERIGLTAVAGSTVIFSLVGTEAAATLHWRDGNRIVTGRAEEIIDAVVGLRLGPATLLSMAAGCAQPGLNVQSAARFNGRLLVVFGQGRAELIQSDRWRVRAAEAYGLGVRYDRFAGSLPSDWRMWSGDAAAPGATLSVRASSAESRSEPLGPEAFPFQLPAGAVPMTLEELRRTVRGE
jgi:hypothetical protein